jgi:hypothetical protein
MKVKKLEPEIAMVARAPVALGCFVSGKSARRGELQSQLGPSYMQARNIPVASQAKLSSGFPFRGPLFLPIAVVIYLYHDRASGDVVSKILQRVWGYLRPASFGAPQHKQMVVPLLTTTYSSSIMGSPI